MVGDVVEILITPVVKSIVPVPVPMVIVPLTDGVVVLKSMVPVPKVVVPEVVVPGFVGPIIKLPLLMVIVPEELVFGIVAVDDPLKLIVDVPKLVLKPEFIESVPLVFVLVLKELVVSCAAPVLREQKVAPSTSNKVLEPGVLVRIFTMMVPAINE